MQFGNGKSEERTISFIKNLSDYVEYCHVVRGLSIHETMLKVGLDGGQGFFKLALSIVVMSSQSNRENSSSESSSNAPERRGSSVNDVFILSLVENVAEDYENCRLM